MITECELRNEALRSPDIKWNTFKYDFGSDNCYKGGQKILIVLVNFLCCCWFAMSLRNLLKRENGCVNKYISAENQCNTKTGQVDNDVYFVILNERRINERSASICSGLKGIFSIKDNYQILYVYKHNISSGFFFKWITIVHFDRANKAHFLWAHTLLTNYLVSE